ncbi:hypothetical protein AB6A40_006027 [Gnathostoma spinigerum]|uniref:Uncharacterized protein n=1 Tax=Gnathostoma spinigerum TaxID=75299 RepID=A0ABD6EQN4_9BILA
MFYRRCCTAPHSHINFSTNHSHIFDQDIRFTHTLQSSFESHFFSTTANEQFEECRLRRLNQMGVIVVSVYRENVNSKGNRSPRAYSTNCSSSKYVTRREIFRLSLPDLTIFSSNEYF